jgi:hypothetical protein
MKPTYYPTRVRINIESPILWNADLETVKHLSLFTPGTEELQLNAEQKHYIQDFSNPREKESTFSKLDVLSADLSSAQEVR